MRHNGWMMLSWLVMASVCIAGNDYGGGGGNDYGGGGGGGGGGGDDFGGGVPVCYLC